MSLLIPPKVYFDESNSTGENLLDPSQPVFSLAAVNVKNDLAAELVYDVISQLPLGMANQSTPPLQRLGTDERHCWNASRDCRAMGFDSM